MSDEKLEKGVYADVQFAEDLKELLSSPAEPALAEGINKAELMKLPDNQLLEVIKKIGSFQILKVTKIDDEFIKQNFSFLKDK